MKKNIMKIISLFVATMILLPALIACGDAVSDNPIVTGGGDTTTDQTVTDVPKIELPAFDYGGHEFKVLAREDTGATGSAAWDIVDISAEEQNGDLINDAVYTRNIVIEDKYNIKITEVKRASSGIANDVQTSVLAGDDVYDALLHSFEGSSAIALAGNLIDLNTVEYLDLSQPWWAQSIINDMSIVGKTFYATGDICLNDDKASWCVLFNKKLSSSLNLPDLYSYARDGKWTLDELHKHAMTGVADLNGDGKMTLEDDQWGIIDQLECAAALFLASGTKLIDKTSDGALKYNLNSEQAINVFGRIYDFMSDTSFQFIVDTHTVPDTWNTVRKYFRADHALFYFSNISALTLIRDMETDYGVLPVPMIFEDQDRYYNTFQYNNATGYSIPRSASDTGRTGIIIESMAMGSPETLTKAYYDTTLQIKAVRDEESIEMLELILNSRIFDFSLAFASIGTMSFLKDQAKQSTNTYTSAEASKQATFLAAIDTVMETISDID